MTYTPHECSASSQIISGVSVHCLRLNVLHVVHVVHHMIPLVELWKESFRKRALGGPHCGWLGQYTC